MQAVQLGARLRLPKLPDDWWDDIWAVPVERASVHGIHGALFYGFPERRKVCRERTWAHDPLGCQPDE